LQHLKETNNQIHSQLQSLALSKDFDTVKQSYSEIANGLELLQSSTTRISTDTSSKIESIQQNDKAVVKKIEALQQEFKALTELVTSLNKKVTKVLEQPPLPPSFLERLVETQTQILERVNAGGLLNSVQTTFLRLRNGTVDVANHVGKAATSLWKEGSKEVPALWAKSLKNLGLTQKDREILLTKAQKQVNELQKNTNTFLKQQGIPDQYHNPVFFVIIAMGGLTLGIITFLLVQLFVCRILYYICCCRCCKRAEHTHGQAPESTEPQPAEQPKKTRKQQGGPVGRSQKK